MSGAASILTSLVLGLFALAAQDGGNSISGHVFGPDRRPAPNLNVELLDDLDRTVGRTQTNGSGRYIFGRLPQGRFKVRVLPAGDLQEQTQSVELVNFSRSSGRGPLVSGMQSAELDFYLRPRGPRGAPDASPAATVFAQEAPAAARAAYEQALSDLGRGDGEAGLRGLEKALEIFPDYYLALDRLGSEYIRRERYEPAVGVLDRAARVNPRGHATLYSLGYAQYSLRRKGEAALTLGRAVSLNPTSVNALVLLGRVLRETGDYAEAERHLKRAKELTRGGVPEVHWQLALLYGNHLQRYREAADELELFLRAQPDSRDAEGIRKLIKAFREKAAQD